MPPSQTGPNVSSFAPPQELPQFKDTYLEHTGIDSIKPGVPEFFTFDKADNPDVVAVIQTFDSDSAGRDEFSRKHGMPAGDQVALVDLRGAQLDNEGFKLFAGKRINPKVQYMLLGSTFDLEQGTGYRGLSAGDTFVFGRFQGDEQQAKTDARSRFSASDATSRYHFSISISEEGTVAIADSGSTNGTRVFTGDQIPVALDETLQNVEVVKQMEKMRKLGSTMLHASTSVDLITGVLSGNVNPDQAPLPRYEYSSTPNTLDFQNALKVDNNELVRDEGNGGRPLSEKYEKNQTDARRYLVEMMQSGSLYKDKETFQAAIQQAHRIAASGGVYQEVGAGNLKVTDENAGRIRREGTPTNSRKGEALRVATIAKKYGDRYGERFSPVFLPNTEASSTVALDRVDSKFWPKDFTDVDSSGKPDVYSYEFDYPDGEGMDQYFDAMFQIGKDITTEMAQQNPNKDRILEMIAEQYQYGAIARPFDQINNSLFMNLANAQIKLLGYNGVTHGEMDLVAQRLQTSTFKHYFKNRVSGYEK